MLAELTVPSEQSLLPDRPLRVDLAHRGKRAAIDWSYDTLAADDRVVFDRMSVFWSGCMLIAAQAVCAGEHADAIEVVESLSSLIDKSLVVAERFDHATRYRQL
jgi:predicted ATPase